MLLLVSSCESGWKTTGWVLYLGRTLSIIGTRSCSCWDQCLLIGDAGTCRLSFPLCQWPSTSQSCAETSYPPTSTSALTSHSLSSLNFLSAKLLITNNSLPLHPPFLDSQSDDFTFHLPESLVVLIFLPLHNFIQYMLLFSLTYQTIFKFTYSKLLASF